MPWTVRRTVICMAKSMTSMMSQLCLLLKREHKSDTFATFKRKLLHTASKYPNASALIPSMQRRVAMCIRKEGEMIKT